MKKMEKDYEELRKKEQEEMVELRVRLELFKVKWVKLKFRSIIDSDCAMKTACWKSATSYWKLKAPNWRTDLFAVKCREPRKKKPSLFSIVVESLALHKLIKNKSHFSFAMQSELLALRRAHLEIAHQLETSNEEIRALSLRLQENVSSAFDLLTNHFSTDINNTKKNTSIRLISCNSTDESLIKTI